MNTSLIIRTYEAEGLQIQVPFTDEGYFSATEVAQAFGKRPNDWLVLPETQYYLNQLPDFLVIEKNLVITKTGPMAAGGGTWLHPKLAVIFARWLDIRFAIWCDLQIEGLLRGQYLSPEDKAEVLTLRNEVNQLTRIVQRMAGEVVQWTGAPPSEPAPQWILMIDRVIMDIAADRFSFSFQIRELEDGSHLVISCRDIINYLSLRGVWATLNVRELRRELATAEVLMLDRRGQPIKEEGKSHIVILNLDALEKYGILVPWRALQ